jgi:hypothetical protein
MTRRQMQKNNVCKQIEQHGSNQLSKAATQYGIALTRGVQRAETLTRRCTFAYPLHLSAGYLQYSLVLQRGFVDSPVH